MGRLNLTALQVRKRAIADLQTKRTKSRPKWVDVMADIPPAQIMIRQQPQHHQLTHVRTQALPDGRTKQYLQSTHPSSSSSVPRKQIKPSRMFNPLPIRYEEDSLRKQFFSDHPWELARPRVVLETTGNQHQHADWSTGLIQPGIALSGESVVQRQLWLLQNTPDITIPEAYDVARKEFYKLRRQEATQRRIAVEEAESTGADFGLTPLNWGMQMENKMYDDWEKWARQQNFELEARNAAFTGQSMPEAEKKIVKETFEVGEGTEAGGRGDSDYVTAPVRRAGYSSSRVGSDVFKQEGDRQSKTFSRT